MIGYFLLGLALLAAALLSMNWFATANPRQVAKAVRWVLVGLAVVLVLAVFLRGWSIYALLGALPALIPFFLRSRMLWQRIKAASGPTPGQRSEVLTRFLRMILDHDSGVMTGEVIEGRFAGRSLDSLSLEQQVELLAECQAADAESASVLEAYLDRVHGEAWHEAASGAGARQAGGGGNGAVMSRDEAYEILGLEPGASDADIRDAHRRLLQKIHPDHGGSNYLAAKINQAKDLLLGA